MNNASADECEHLKPETREKKANSCCARFSNVFKHITVEPTGGVYLGACIFVMISSQTLQLEKTCRVNLSFGDEICTALRNQNYTATNISGAANISFYEKQVQQYVARRLAWKSVLQSVLPCITLVFIGAWSDKTGRRIAVIAVPMIGEILHCISNILNVYFFYELPVEVLIVMDVTFVGVVGGWATLFLGMFSYIGDITTEQNRTHRLGFVQFCTYIGLPIGLGLSGIILKKFGYYVLYSSALVLHILNMLYITCKLKNPERSAEQKTVS